MDKLEPLAVSALEAARLLGVSKPTVYQMMNREDFPAFKVGTRTLISVEGLREWIRKQVNEQ
ncbi:helix-turn-helix domain-containing protein [Flintibacter sp. P01028]|uniref:helix-turn-helix domain-containing protein n=1 Tax=Flintibacter sp. P01028 TaxID=3342382 RepID=UPI0035B6A8B9